MTSVTTSVTTQVKAKASPQAGGHNRVVTFERQMMLERQREGIAKAKADGKYKGRAPTAMRQALRARELAAEGVQRAEIAHRLGVSERSVYRALSGANRNVVEIKTP